jgi:large subunit ribosomal protein L15
MTFKKKKKNVNQRAKTTHGWGSKKKHRGAGNRGGRGNSGSGKRGDAKNCSYGPEHFGKSGFKKKNKEVIKTITLQYLQQKADALVTKGFAEKKGETYSIHLAKLKGNKLLAKGTLTKKLEVTTQYASQGAIACVEKAGGKVLLLEAKTE